MREIDTIFFKDLPPHADRTISQNPVKVVAIWLRKYLKEDITVDDVLHFISKKPYYYSLQDYEYTLHHLVLKECLQIDLSQWDWCFKYWDSKNDKKLLRHIKLWSLKRY